MSELQALSRTDGIVLQGRFLTPAHLADIKAIISAHPGASRNQLSILLAKRWNWRSASGQLKDMAARTLMLKLHTRGWIALPERRRDPSKRIPTKDIPELFDTTVPGPIHEALNRLLPLQIMVLTPQTVQPFHRALALHHYLGFRGPVGENIAYQVRDRLGRDLACVLFGAAAWKVAPRDAWIGWSGEIRQKRLAFIANNSRFLILPWVKVPHLASHILGRISRRISSDWQIKYAHPLYLLETFIEQDRFKGTCYKAANWICVGQTQGRSRQDRYSTLKVPVKDIYLYPLDPHAARQLRHEDA
jgi:hypothetical protein